LARKLVAGSYLDGSGEAAVVVGAKLAERLKLESEKELRRQLDRLHPLVRWSGLERERLAGSVRMHLAVGKKMVIASNNIDGKMVEELVRVKGVFQTGAVEIDGFFIQVPIDFARRLYGMKADQATQVGVLVSDIDQRDAIQARILAGLELDAAGPDERLAVLRWEQVLPDLAAYIKIDGGSNYIFQGILIFLVMFTIFNTILMSVLERRREFAVLLALGTPAARLKAQILLETILISLIGVGLGLLIGGLGAYAMQVHGLDLTHLYEESISVSGVAVDPVIYALVTPGLLAGVGGIVFGCTLLLSLYPMKRIDRIPVADVLR
jgi:ABC-type lipoprotein release transport system permease subunit